MWKISKLKREARRSLSDAGYWIPFIVSLLYGFIYAGFSKGGTGAAATTAVGTQTPNITIKYDIEAFRGQFENITGRIYSLWNDFIANPVMVIMSSLILVSIIVAVVILSCGWSAFVADPLTVGKNRYYMEHRAFPTTWTKLFYSFRTGRYFNIVKIMFLMRIKIFLWSLLFIIPGIIKSYEYYMIPYILAENPQITTERAFELSRKMTKGEKLHIFGLELSFIGWHILGILCCCVGGYFLDPYIHATFAELYEVMREKAHGTEISDYAELPGFFPEQV